MSEPMRFAILGAAGFVAPRHMAAIRKIGGEIVAAVDPNDAVGVLDQYAPDARYFRHFEAFLPWLARQKETLHVVIATPNDLHVGQALAVQEVGHVPIVEKPVALSLADANLLLGAPGYAVLQMRLHPEAKRLVQFGRDAKGSRVVVDYRAPRGPWYAQSWKSDLARSGGVATNLGIHVLDLLGLAFGEVRDAEGASGSIQFDRAEVDFLFSTGGPERRYIEADGEVFDLSNVDGLHDRYYEALRDGTAPTIEDSLACVALAERLRL